jgi:signal transduction histidine kinase/ActR/RegA family two-component response regulator
MHPSAKFAPGVDDLESVITTAELSRRPLRAPDYAAESRMLASLAQNMAHSPELILHNLAQAALTSCRAGSAGISLIEEDGKHFRWHALVGELAPHVWGTTPRSFSPCGTVVDRNSIHLFSLPHRHFQYFAEVKPVIVEALLIPFSFAGAPAGTIWVVTHDERRQFDAEDARLIDNLGRFAAAAYKLRSSLAAAEEASRHKDEFLAMLAHELRNPLFPMQVVVDSLARTPAPSGDVKHASAVMQRQLKHLNHLVDDLMDIARISRGKLALRKERVALSSIVQHALETSRPIIDKAGHSLFVTLPASPAFVDADPVRLAQVVSNLLNNAAKFTATGGHLRVSAEAQGGEAVIRVRDDGIGIAADRLSGVFQLYTQLQPSGAGAEAGMGIGLALARSLVELHGGTLEAHSPGPAKGSEFVVRLPLLASPVPPSVAISPPPSPRDESGRLRILVVDDHRDTADALAWVLHSIGHETRAAYDGPSALQAVEEHSPDVIIQDLFLPYMSGYEVARRVREHSAAKHAVLVALTGSAQAAALHVTEGDAFDHLLVKPVGLAALEEMLSSACSRRGGKNAIN